MLAWNPNPRNRAGIAAAAERTDVPGGAAATDVHATDQGIIGQTLRSSRLSFGGALAVD